MSLIDKNGKPIPGNSIVKGRLPGHVKEYYWSIWEDNGKVHMIACEWGYEHDVTQDKIANFELIGPHEKFRHLLECD